MPGAMVAESSNNEGAVKSSEHVRSGKILAMTRRMETSSFLVGTDNDGVVWGGVRVGWVGMEWSGVVKEG